MERLQYEVEARGAATARKPVLVGVTASGNCEVLVEAGGAPERCAIDVHTAAQGFGPIWQAVLRDFGERHAAGGLKIEIHDVGATPAVVSLRLDQALEAWEDDDA
ncbi:MAG: malonate decarboxylase acyl carrier protein [Azoarcus sp.]|nr:malonate decarboxylase acyl carrier protein [Azoarcus sp.]